MGLRVYSGDRTLWEPSQKVGRLFVAQMRALEQVFGYRSGIGDVTADEVELDAGLLAKFLESLLSDLTRTKNETEYNMITECLAIAVALYSNTAGKPPNVPEKRHPRLDNILRRATTITWTTLVPLDDPYGRPPARRDS